MIRSQRRGLRRKSEFDRVFQEGRRYRDKGLLMLVVRVYTEPAWKLGIIVSRKWGKAVQRNRFRRRVREWFRKHSEEVPAGHWYLVLPSGVDSSASGTSLYEALRALIARVAVSPEGGRV